MADKNWGHCQHCKFFASPAPMPVEDEEAACKHPVHSKYQLLVFGACGCNGFELRPGLEKQTEQPPLVT